MFDTERQQTFIPDWLVKELKLALLRQIEMKASAFLNTEESNITLSEYEIVAKSVRNNQKRATIALGVPKICSDWKMSHTKS